MSQETKEKQDGKERQSGAATTGSAQPPGETLAAGSPAEAATVEAVTASAPAEQSSQMKSRESVGADLKETTATLSTGKETSPTAFSGASPNPVVNVTTLNVITAGDGARNNAAPAQPSSPAEATKQATAPAQAPQQPTAAPPSPETQARMRPAERAKLEKEIEDHLELYRRWASLCWLLHYLTWYLCFLLFVAVCLVPSLDYFSKNPNRRDIIICLAVGFVVLLVVNLTAQLDKRWRTYHRTQKKLEDLNVYLANPDARGQDIRAKLKEILNAHYDSTIGPQT